jgi:hypothetical protein
VVVLNARISDEGDRKAIEHLIDTFEVACGRATSQVPALGVGFTGTRPFGDLFSFGHRELHCLWRLTATPLLRGLGIT